MSRYLTSYIPFFISCVIGILFYGHATWISHLLLGLAILGGCVLRPKAIFYLLLIFGSLESGFWLRFSRENQFDQKEKEIQSYTNHKYTFEGEVLSHPVPSKHEFSYILGVEKIEIDQTWIDASFQFVVHSKTYLSPQKGDRIRIRAKPYVLNETYISQKIRNVHAYATIYEKDVEVIQQKNSWSTLVRQKIFSVAQKYLSPSSYTYFRVMAFGDQALLGASMMQRLKETGLLHLFVISGYHISFVWILGMYLFRIGLGWYPWFHRKKQFFSWITYLNIGFVFVFLAWINPPISTFRAVSSLILFALLQSSGRKQPALYSLGFVFFVLLLLNPLYLYDVSTQLTFASVTGILLFHQVFQSWINQRCENLSGLQTYIVGSLSVTCGAALFTMPILYFHFGCVYPISFVYNLLITPTLGLWLSFLSIAMVFGSLVPCTLLHKVGFYFLDLFFCWFEKILNWDVKVQLYTLQPLFTSYSKGWLILSGIVSCILLSVSLYRKRKQTIY